MDMPTTVPPSKRKQYAQDRRQVIDGFDRAMHWLRQNTRSSIGAFSIHIDKRFGARIELHPPCDTAARKRWMKRMFSGMQATCTHKPLDCFKYYRVEDEANQLAFTWHEYISSGTSMDPIVKVVTL